MAKRTPHSIGGVAMIVLSSDRKYVLIAKRIKQPGAGYQIPGGCVEEGETLKEAAIRETREETGIVLNPAKTFFSCAIQSGYYGSGNLHLIFYSIVNTDEIPPNPEPHKCEDWQWYTKDTIPDGVWYRMSRMAVDNFFSKEPQNYIEDQTEIGKIK